MRRKFREHDYKEVRTPTIMDRTLWEKSGHWENYHDNMFTTCSENRDYAVKPMNCPGMCRFSITACTATAICLASGGVRFLPPQRDIRFAARFDAGARLHPGRRAHLLYRRPSAARGVALHRDAERGISRFRFQRSAG